LDVGIDTPEVDKVEKSQPSKGKQSENKGLLTTSMQSLFAARFTAKKEDPEVEELEERIAAYQDLLTQNEHQ
jgi:hypothetical protein